MKSNNEYCEEKFGLLKRKQKQKAAPTGKLNIQYLIIAVIIKIYLKNKLNTLYKIYNIIEIF